MRYTTLHPIVQLNRSRFNSLFATLLLGAILAVFTSCEVLDDPASSQGDNPNTDVPAEDAIDRGSGNVTLEAAAFAALLHNDSSKTWAADQFTIEGFSLFQQCRLDDVMTLHNDGTYNYDGGNQLCGAEDDTRLRTGTYTFDVDAATITFDAGTALEATATVVTLEAGTAVLEGQYVSDVFGTFDVAGRYTSSQQ